MRGAAQPWRTPSGNICRAGCTAGSPLIRRSPRLCSDEAAGVGQTPRAAASSTALQRRWLGVSPSVRKRLPQADNANPMIGELGMGAGEFILRHVTLDAIR